MGSFIKRFFVITVLVFIFSYFNYFVHVDSIKIALLVSLTVSIFLFLIKLLADILKVAGCFTAGLTYIAGLILSIFALPLALFYAQDYVDGFAVKSFLSAVLFSIIICIAQSLVDVKK